MKELSIGEIPQPSTLTIFVGRFGSGKTEVAINYALSVVRAMKTGNSFERPPSYGRSANSVVSEETPCRGVCTPPVVVLVDLDIVTPYFRSREIAEAMQDRGVKVVAPSVLGQHLDIPAIGPQILGAIQQSDRPTILDVGGDKQGARALGQFSPAIQHRGYTMHFVVNPYRPFTDTLDGLSTSVAEIEVSSRLAVSSLVSNPNLIGETTAERIVEGHAKIERFAQALGLPIAFVCIEQRWIGSLGSNHIAQPILALERFFTMSWE
jgi:hypothetical protein